MTPKAVIFDLYGTLIDLYSWEDNERRLAGVASTLSVPAKPFSRLWTETYPERVTGVFPDDESYILHLCARLKTVPSDTSLQAAIEMKNEFTRRLMVPRPGARETLQKLKEAGLGLALLTNCGREVPGYWGRTSLASVVEVAVFSCEVKVKKPDPAAYFLTCDRLNVQPRDCTFVGDGGNRELEAAQEIGMKAIMIRTPEDNLYNPRRTASDAWLGRRVSRLNEVIDIVFEDVE